MLSRPTQNRKPARETGRVGLVSLAFDLLNRKKKHPRCGCLLHYCIVFGTGQRDSAPLSPAAGVAEAAASLPHDVRPFQILRSELA